MQLYTLPKILILAGEKYSFEWSFQRFVLLSHTNNFFKISLFVHLEAVASGDLFVGSQFLNVWQEFPYHFSHVVAIFARRHVRSQGSAAVWTVPEEMRYKNAVLEILKIIKIAIIYPIHF